MPTPFTMVVDVFHTARNFTAWSTPNLGRSSLAKLDTVEYYGKTLVHPVVPHADAGERGFGFLGLYFIRSEVRWWVYRIWGTLFGLIYYCVSSIGLGSLKCITLLLSVGLHWVSLCYTLFMFVHLCSVHCHVWSREINMNSCFSDGQGRCWPCQCCQWFLQSQLGQRLPWFASDSLSGQCGTI